MMGVVFAVTAACVYLAEKSRQRNQQRVLDAQFQAQTASFLAVEEAHSDAIKEKCRAISHSVRIRAALEEREVEDLYQNAISEFQNVLGSGVPNLNTTFGIRASFFRFFDAQGVLLAPEHESAGLVDHESLDESLVAMGKMLGDIGDQSVFLIALARSNQPRALREVVLTRIRDSNGRNLGALAVAFPISDLQDKGADGRDKISSGIWFNRRLYIDELDDLDRHIVAERIAAIPNHKAGHLFVELKKGPNLLYYEALDSEAKPAPTYQVCLYPLATSIRENRTLRWKIIGFGLGVLFCGFVVSFFFTEELAKPVDKIVAGSVENLTRRKQAEEDLRETNRELEKALTELKATQAQVIQQERLSAVGQMASGIAHDFNNTLVPILGFTDLLLTNDKLLDNKTEARRCLEMMRTAAKDAASVVSRLREFYRPTSSDEAFPIVDMAKVVRQAVSLTEPKWRSQSQAKGIQVEVTADIKAAPFVAGEESALREILTNLIFNAVDAMPNGGRVLLETSMEMNNAVVRVRDTGTGMSESIRQRCLEPFFSTKGELGTGLGLSMVHGIVERHRGNLEIESTLGQGTTFTIKLPLAENISTPVQEQTPLPASKSILNVLIVDDEPPVLEVLSRYLRTDGHAVATAESGREALAKFRHNLFDLVVLDRAMPDMSGDQTAQLIKESKQDTPVIMLTGFGNLVEVAGGHPENVDVVLSKPVTLDALRRTIGKLVHVA